MSDSQLPIIQNSIENINIIATITNIDDFNDANMSLAKFKDMLKAVDMDEKSITAPINNSLRDIRAKYKPVKERLERAIATLRDAMNVYKRAEDAKREKDRLALESLAKDGASLTELVSLVEEAPSLGGRLTTTVDVTQSLLPVSYQYELLTRCWDKAMIEIRKDVATGRVETGVIVTKAKVI